VYTHTQELVSGYAADDATGIVTAAREYRAGRAVVEFTVHPVPSTRRIEKIKIYCRNNFSRNDELNLFIYS
jgi:hypothetical protein